MNRDVDSSSPGTAFRQFYRWFLEHGRRTFCRFDRTPDGSGAHPVVRGSVGMGARGGEVIALYLMHPYGSRSVDECHFCVYRAAFVKSLVGAVRTELSKLVSMGIAEYTDHTHGVVYRRSWLSCCWKDGRYVLRWVDGGSRRWQDWCETCLFSGVVWPW